MSMLVAVLSLSTIIRWIRSAIVSGRPACSPRSTPDPPTFAASSSVSVVSIDSRPSCTCCQASTMTAVLIVLAVGKRISALTAIVSPVRTSMAATPICPLKAPTAFSS